MLVQRSRNSSRDVRQRTSFPGMPVQVADAARSRGRKHANAVRVALERSRRNAMNELLLLPPTCRPAYASFRDEAVSRGARHLRSRELRQRRLNMLAAALLLVGASLCGVMLTSPGRSQAFIGSQASAACLKAKQSLEPWFRAELNRRQWAVTLPKDDFTLLLTGLRNAERQCGAGLSDQALGNFAALSARIATLEERRHASAE
jgi:hypothetical protein